MEKILKKYTTIPEHLYVERDADIQLRSIIQEMQRPGYVLVARQMGKTNLLFNAKRTLENKNRLFVYVDLSNLYDNERDCYRNIINNIIEPNSLLFESIEDDIEKIRLKNLPPHNEYSRCLRTVLNFFKGDLVIILDEIDALKSIDYSDNIFAQIRSNYFSRTNFPVFERLTYVLSGVIEPTELIKDRNKSPFNIGDKIYLDDFNNDEHNIFISKSKLNLNQTFSDEIYNWTNGNPRLTFDICSELEDEIINTRTCTIEKLEFIIKKKYLTSFDIAPIDHIRELVKTNKPIRKSILSIHKNNSSDITDEIKKKLYLYGIINSKFDERTKIKNKIIEYSLSEEWLKSIDRNNEISLVYGLAKYDSKEYLDAIEILEIIVNDINSSKNDIEAANYFLGSSYFKLQEYKKASEYFEKDFPSVLYSSDAMSFLGICKIATDEKDEGIKILQESIKDERNNFAYHNAMLNLAINIDDLDEAYLLLNKLFESTFLSKSEKDEELDQLRTLSLYYQYRLLINRKEIKEAHSKIARALDFCTLSESILLNMLRYELSEIKHESIKSDLVKKVIDNNILLENKNITPISFGVNSLLSILDFVFNKTELFESLLEYASNKLLPELSKFEIVYRTLNKSTINKEIILEYLEEINENFDSSLIVEVYKNLALNYIENTDKHSKYFNKYLSAFNQVESINSNDIYLFAFAIKSNYDSHNLREALKLSLLIEKRTNKLDNGDLKFESVIIYYWLTNIYAAIKDRINALIFADISLNLIKNSKRTKTSMIDEEGISSIQEQLLGLKNQFTFVQPVLKPIINSNKYNRNDIVEVKYNDGKVLRSKYKKVEQDLLSGKCKIL